MRIRVDIHWEPDRGPVECWITGYDIEGHQEYCGSTHQEEVLRAADRLVNAAVIATHGIQLSLSPFP